MSRHPSPQIAQNPAGPSPDICPRTSARGGGINASATFTPTPEDLDLEARIEAATDLNEILELIRQRRPEYAEYLDAEKLRRVLGKG